MTMMRNLVTDYSSTEDRVRLRCTFHDGGCATVWLTRRLTDQVVRHLAGMLERLPAEALAAPEEADGGAAGAATPAAEAPSAEPPSEVDFARRQWLAQAIDVSPTTRHVQLTFRNSERAAQIAMDPATLQKWQDCLLEVYRTAAWTAPAPKTRAEQDAPSAPIRALKITH
ncbi:MAG: hypothetical protein ACKO9D_14830 [Gammaproteobacteria bacterium]